MGGGNGKRANGYILTQVAKIIVSISVDSQLASIFFSKHAEGVGHTKKLQA